MSSEKNLGITVSGEISDILAKLDEVIGKIESVPDRNIELGINVNDTNLDSVGDDALAAADDILKIGDAGEKTSLELSSSMESASSSVSDVGKSSEDAKIDIEDMGNSSDETSDSIILGMGAAAATIAGIGLEADDAAKSINEMSFSYYKLGSGFTGGESALRDQVATITDAKFPEDEAISYIRTLKQLGVAQDDLIGTSVELNKIRSATGASTEDMTPLLQAYKAMGLELTDLEDTYNATYYANAKFVGGLSAYTTELRRYSSDFRDLGLNADQAAVVMVAAQNKWPDPKKRRTELRKAIDESNGDLNLLAQKVGLTAGDIQNAASITGQYNGKVEDAAKKSRELATETEKIGAWVEDLKIRFGAILGPAMSYVGILGKIGGAYLAVWGIIKAGKKYLGWETDFDAKMSKPFEDGFSRIKKSFDDFTSYASQKAKSWSGWGDDSKKATDTIINDITKASPKAEEAGIKFGNALGEGISSGIKSSAVLLDESGNVLWTDTEGIIKNIGTKGSSLAESTGFRIPSLFGKGFLAGATKAVPDIAAGAIQLIDGLANYTEYLKDPLGSLFGPVKYLIPPQILALNELASPEKIMTALIGPEGTQGFMNWAKIKIEDPMRKALGDTFGDVTSWWDNLTKSVGLNTVQNANTTTDGVTAATNKAASVAESAAAKMRISTENSYAAQIAAAQKYAEAALAAYETATAAAEASWSRMSSMLSAMNISLPGATYSTSEMLTQRNQALSDLRNQRNALTQAGTAAFGGSYTKYKNALDDIDRQIKQLSSYSVLSSIAKSGQSVGSSWGSGVASGVALSQGNISSAVGTASSSLIANSPPKTGPLSKIDQDALTIGQLFTQNLAKGLTGVSDVLGLGDMTLSTPLPSASSVSNISSVGGATFYFTGDIIVPEGSDPVAVGRDLGTGINESLAERLSGQGNSRGVNYVNLNR